MMTKLKYYALAADQLKIDLPWTEGLEVLEDLYQQTYVTIAAYDQSIMDQLREGNFLDISTDKCAISELAQELIETAAALFVAGEKPTLAEKPRGSTKRPIRPEMIELQDHILKYLEGKIEVGGLSEDRSNLFVNFKKRKKGIGCIEIKNKPELRVSIRKASKETIALFESLGMTHRSTPTITYFDMPQTIENAETLIDTIVEFFKG